MKTVGFETIIREESDIEERVEAAVDFYNDGSHTLTLYHIVYDDDNGHHLREFARSEYDSVPKKDWDYIVEEARERAREY